MQSDLKKLLRYIITSASILLFISFFMPAVSGCENTPVYPYETLSAPIYFPYFWSLGLFVYLVLLNIKKPKVQTTLKAFYFIISISWMVVWGYTIHSEIIRPDSRITLDILFPFIIWWLVFALIINKIKNIRNNFNGFFKRSVWSFGLMGLSFYVIFFIDSHFYGVDISFTASLTLLITGILYEFSETILNFFRLD